MRLGIYNPVRFAESGRLYMENIVRELERSDVRTVFMSGKDPLPRDVDLYWDPRSMGGLAPFKGLKTAGRPVVVTVHGAAPFALPAREYFPGFFRAAALKLYNMKKLLDWKPFRGRLTAIITVSVFAKVEIEACLYLKGENIVPIHHGVDHDLFKPSDLLPEEPYLLTISHFQALKNLDRLFAAYNRLSMAGKPPLVAVVPGYTKKEAGRGIRVLRTPMAQNRLAELYQGAMGFLFPSLIESFGMPLVEAMACGCPVITSRGSACEEVTAGAALLVNPRSTEEIATTIEKLVVDEKLRQILREKGIKQAAMFSWKKSAREHLKVFENALGR